MRRFVLHLQSVTRYERMEDVVSFVGVDTSGSFGIQAGHARAVTCVTFGLARFRVSNGDWQYVALPGAVLYFRDNQLFLTTRHFVLGDDYDAVGRALAEDIATEDDKMQTLMQSLQQLEQAMFKRLWSLEREWGSAL
jgi:F-type H+-transporting ATPase subunit epsilon